ncbi:MAG TPA: hypothetical protein VJL07_02780 [Dehalococcoidia bacterium]|nr:hypothetical protein [Dehalococcoidia bacterium]
MKLPLPRHGLVGYGGKGGRYHDVVHGEDVVALEAAYERAMKVVEAVRATIDMGHPAEVLVALRELDGEEGK